MDEKQMKKAVFHVSHIQKCGKQAFDCGKPEEKRRFCKENHRFDRGKEKESGKRKGQKAQKPCESKACGFLDKSRQGSSAHGKAVDKKFFDVGKCVENVTKPRKTVIFRALQAKNDGF